MAGRAAYGQRLSGEDLHQAEMIGTNAERSAIICVSSIVIIVALFGRLST